MEDWLVAWDDPDDPGGNVAHIAEHGLTTEDVEEVLLNADNANAFSRSSGLPCKFGYTSAGRFIIVVFTEENDDPKVVFPVTAYDVPEPN